MDRRQALARREALPDRAHGAALFADISGFTPLAEALVRELGPQRGAEELTRQLNLIYDALIAELERYGGSVIGFGGDAITCWLDGDSGLRATACALAMQQAMEHFAVVSIPSGNTISLAMKAAVAVGPVRRFVVGDPNIQIMDVLAGALLHRLSVAEHQAGKGEVVLDPATAAALHDHLRVVEWRQLEGSHERFAVVSGLSDTVLPAPWPALSPDVLSDEQARPWLLPIIYERLRSGQGEFLAELRPAVVLFLSFGGIDYDGDEAAGAKLDAYVRQAQHVMARYDGSLLQMTIGDKGSYLYVSFGAPLAHEDDAVRAVSAALELRKLTPSFSFITHVQIGINQGRMRTGAYGGTTRRTYGVIGDDVNLAARLMQAAAPGQILVGKTTYLATGDVFNWESLPPIKVKGKTEPVTLFNLIGSKERLTVRLRAARYALPMVGREAELAVVTQKLAQIVRGQGQMVGILGEAGMGKSRLIAEIIRLAGEQQISGYGGECQSYGTNTSYLVWQAIWRAFFDLDPRASLEEQTRALEAQLSRVDPALAPRLPLLGAVLNLSLPDNDLTRSFDAKLRKTSLEALLLDCLRARARHAPLLLVLEDCHWLDPLSHDLLEAVGRATADLPVLLVLAYRPSGAQRAPVQRLRELPNFTEILLAEFTAQEAKQLIDLKLEQAAISPSEVPRALIERVTARAEGNPFYIEELLNYLHDRQIDPRDEQALEQLDLPTSLHSLILSRIDQLTESQKITLKVASVIGRKIIVAMLWGVYPQLGDGQRVRANLEAMSRLDLTAPDTAEPELAYLFKHIATQEVAYESLPYATRATLHEQIGQFIESHYADSLDEYVDLLAYHYDRSQNEAKKREYLLKAGEAAQADYANPAALDYYQRVLPLLPASERVPVMRKLAQVLELVSRWNEADDLYQQSIALAELLSDQQAQAQGQAAVGELRRKQSRYAEALEWLERAQASFEALGDEAGVAQVLHYAGSLAAQQGDFQTARARYEKSLAIRRKLEDKPRIGSLLSNLGIVARYQGDYALARSLHEEGLAIRRELGDRWAIANSLNNLGNVALDQGNYVEAGAWLQEAVSLQRVVGDRWALANSLNNLGNVERAQGSYATARARYHESLLTNYELGDRWALAYLFEDLSGLACLENQPQRAVRLAGAAAVLREAIRAPLSAAERAKLDRALEPARQVLSAEAQAALEAEGRAMSLEQAIQYALADEQNSDGSV